MVDAERKKAEIEAVKKKEQFEIMEEQYKLKNEIRMESM